MTNETRADRGSGGRLKKILILGAVALTIATAIAIVVVRVRFGHLGLRARVLRAVATDERLDLGVMARLPWDEVHVFGPYTSRAALTEGKLVPPVTVFGLRLEARDDVCVLLFTESDRYSTHVVIPRAVADLVPSVRPAPYPRGEAKFVVREESGRRVVIPAR